MTTSLLVAADETSGGGFVGPSLADFFPPVLLFAGTPFELNRVMIVRLIAVAVLLLLLWLGTRRMTLVPNRAQVVTEGIMGFVRNDIVYQTLGEKEGNRFMPILMPMFFLVLAMNITGVIPGLQIAGTSVIGVPIVLALIAYIMFVYAGLRKFGLRFFKNQLLIPGVPWPIYFVIIPLEFLSTFILRPVTLTLRLLMNMVAGHMLLVLCFTATSFFFFTVLADGNFFGLLGFGSFAFGIAFLLLELFVAFLQAYVFAILSAIYIQLSIAESH